MSEKTSFLQLVKNQIKSNEAKKFVTLELDSHIEDTAQRLMNAGFSREDAEAQAVQQMGDPVKLGLKMGRLHRPKIDWSLLSLFIFLHLLGLLPLLITNFEYQPSIYQQSISIILGTICVFSVMLFDYRKLKEKAWLVIGIAGIILLLFFYFGTYINDFYLGTYRNGYPYIRFGFFSSNSIAVLPFLFIGWAGIFNRYANRYLLMIGLFSFTLLLYIPVSILPNIIIYVLMVFTMYVWTIRKRRKRVLGSFIAFIIGGSSLLVWKYNPFYMKHRLLGFLNPEKYADGSGFLNVQIKKYLSEASWFGQINKLENFSLPESHTDYVFVTLTYSLGWIFSIGLVLFLIAVTIRLCWMSRKIVDTFGQLIIIGAATLYTVPFIYNITMVLGWLPLAGFWLPFISYGTIHVLINSVLIGLVLSVYRRKDLVAPA
ncbi:FtsW/RodA/SpoVE family cell cycle protein [Lederbergia citrea]|uniref:FtsW/RodA/SpoVE family cell cycle protein n=1 Tax=Lederbergia citrea TaxID=2833581 RepID=A0A942Z5C2_9BACI|nr:FtsW/RodA/SpoVE family cell cycle protein [Lederbergia citrea]MBS4205957.1 FtsW/RodA/SpoVE family cell cycle protein [Lederbergia citrea]MBS4224594.1 FtsW/RodA/SpoVE family cell cycle protein [Lederbergia citrea]